MFHTRNTSLISSVVYLKIIQQPWIFNDKFAFFTFYDGSPKFNKNQQQALTFLSFL